MLKDNNDMAIKLSVIIQYNTPNFPNIQLSRDSNFKIILS